MRAFISGFLFCLGIYPGLAQEKSAAVPTVDRALLWEISGKNLASPSYLYGTIHMICADDFILPDSVKQTFGRCGKIYLEIDMDDPSMAFKTLQLSFMKEHSLKDLMSKEEYAGLEKFMRDSIGVPLMLFNKMKPFTLLSVLYTKILPCSKMESYEQHFQDMAKKQEKELLGLEKLEDQFAVFDKIPDSMEVRMILEMVNHFAEQKKEFSEMAHAYTQRDLDALHKMISQSPDMAGFEDLLLDQRNESWITVMEKAMALEPIFFAVGAGHLPGEKGVITLLRRAGYKVRPIE
jgi:hypothetical protein